MRFLAWLNRVWLAIIAHAEIPPKPPQVRIPLELIERHNCQCHGEALPEGPYYVKLTGHTIARSEEIIDGVLIVDYDAFGKPVGIEILSGQLC